MKIKAPERLISFLQLMLQELNDCRLDVQLVFPDFQYNNNNGQKIRVVCNSNPDWYRELILSYPSNRRKPKRRGFKFEGTDTRIKRRSIERILKRLASGQKSSSQYAKDLLEIADKKYQKDKDLQEEYKKTTDYIPF